MADRGRVPLQQVACLRQQCRLKETSDRKYRPLADFFVKFCRFWLGSQARPIVLSTLLRGRPSFLVQFLGKSYIFPKHEEPLIKGPGRVLSFALSKMKRAIKTAKIIINKDNISEKEPFNFNISKKTIDDKEYFHSNPNRLQVNTSE